MGNVQKNIYIYKSGDHNGIPRPLYNGNMAKVSFLKWSQNLNFVTGRSVFSKPKLLPNWYFLK